MDEDVSLGDAEGMVATEAGVDEEIGAGRAHDNATTAPAQSVRDFSHIKVPTRAILASPGPPRANLSRSGD